MTTKVSAALIAARNMKRQTALFGSVDSSGYANFLTTGSGLRPGLLATSVALALSYANGLAENVEQITADVADIIGSNLPASNTSFIHKTLGGAYASTLVPPQYGYAFDRTKGALLNFEGADGSTSIIDDFGNTWTTTGNAQIDTAQSKFGTGSVLFDGTGDRIGTSNILTLGDGSWEMSLWFRFNALPGVGTVSRFLYATNGATFGVTVGIANTAGTSKLTLHVSSTGTSWDVADGTAAGLGANTTWALNQWNRMRVVFDALAGTYRVYLSLNGAVETADISVTSSAKVCSLAALYLGADTTATSAFNGWIDAFRFVQCATNTSVATPSVSAPSITDYPVHWFSLPEMKMYEVTSASSSAGTNPGMTRRDRLFLGECDTSGAAVTAARTYALRGQYRSPLTAMPAAAGSASFASNLGVMTGVRVANRVVCVTAHASTEVVGAETEALVFADSGGNQYFGNPVILRSRGNTLSFTLPGNLGGNGALLRSDGLLHGILASDTGYKFVVEAERAW
jgi:hypothetical protein